MSAQSKNPVFVTGLSGAGMSTALGIFEDLGYEVVDNLPLSLIDSLFKEKSPKPGVALGIDSRTRNFDPHEVIAKAREYGARLLFVTCDTAVLQRRFSETRRKHPLAADRAVIDGIDMERRRLAPLRERTDEVIDTSELTIHDMRRIVAQRFALSDESAGLSITLMSFGFKNGLPRESDIIQDVRFLKNPNWKEDLKDLTGLHAPVAQYIRQDENFVDFFKNFQNLLKPLLPGYIREGKSYLTIAVGCTGGKHRSVYTVEQLAVWLKDLGYTVRVYHRDMPGTPGLRGG